MTEPHSPADPMIFLPEHGIALPQIQTLRPSSTLPDDIQRLGLDDLVMSGYKITDPTVIPSDLALGEYDGPDDIFLSYVAVSNERAIGSLSINIISKEHEIGDEFWKALEAFAPDTYNAVQAYSPMAINIWGNVVMPEEQSGSIPALLTRTAIDELRPSLILDQSNSENDVEERALTLNELGYRTFYGAYEVTPGQPGVETTDHQAVVKAYLFARGVSLDQRGVLPVENEPTIKPAVSSGIPTSPAVTEAHAHVLNAQQMTPETPVVVPLISIHHSIISS